MTIGPKAAGLILFALLVLLLPNATACTEAPATILPAVVIQTPVSGRTISPSDTVLEIKLKVHNFKLDSKNIGATNQPGAGHVHLEINGLSIVRTAETTTKVKLFSPGQYTVSVELSNNDKTSLSPPVKAVATVRYQVPSKVKVSKGAIVHVLLKPEPIVDATFQRERAALVEFLQRLARISPDFVEPDFPQGVRAEYFTEWLSRHDPAEITAQVAAMRSNFQGYQREILGLSPPVHIPLAEQLKRALLHEMRTHVEVFQRASSLAKERSREEISVASLELAIELNNADRQRRGVLSDLLAMYNIAEEEIRP